MKNLIEKSIPEIRTPEEWLIKMSDNQELLADGINYIHRRVSKLSKNVNGRFFLVGSYMLAGLYFIMKLSEKHDKLNARVMALEISKDAEEFEKSIEKEE